MQEVPGGQSYLLRNFIICLSSPNIKMIESEITSWVGYVAPHAEDEKLIRNSRQKSRKT
jgi:hypothetical protein